uniref:SERPIN domain-containing protein n=1 Tax=Caenorhabditis japonica TaxID=281687 RepID=A0A8R1DZH4_CAEJA
MFLQAETTFGLNLLKTLPANESLVFSPLSIALVLSLVHSGAKGKSREQIGDALLNGASDDQFNSHFQFISETLRKGENGVKVNVANKVFVGKDFKVKPDYLTTVKKNFNTGAENVNFASPEAVKSINNFVKSATENKIDNLVTQDSLKDAVALLINAIYFKGDWDEEFEGMSTRPENFNQVSGKVQKIPFMHDYRTDRVYGSDDLFHVAILDYKDPKYRFAIFVPKVKNGLAGALKKFDSARFQKLLSTAKRTYMNTFIPKFTVEKQVPLKNTLIKLGITDIFSDSADLSGIADHLKISDGAHKAIIEVNEKGTVAAAATSVKAVPMMLRMDEPIDFRADHPFLFALVHESHPLFLGVFHG